MSLVAVVPAEDPLAHLPCSLIEEYQKGQTVYEMDAPANRIFLVIDGKVMVSRCAEGGQAALDINVEDDFFGVAAFLRLSSYGETAVALEGNTRLMVWSMDNLEGIIMKRPKLGIALMQFLARRILDYSERLESYSVDDIPRRLVRILIYFSEKSGVEEDDGSVGMSPLTHEQLSQFVGTSREIITHYMNEFRRMGYLKYSRKGIILQRNALEGWLNQPKLQRK